MGYDTPHSAARSPARPYRASGLDAAQIRSRAAALSGTACTAPFFVRSPGRVQIAKSSEIAASDAFASANCSSCDRNSLSNSLATLKRTP
jgi:hypothetical protein